jgi:hypothetical protein
MRSSTIAKVGIANFNAVGAQPAFSFQRARTLGLGFRATLTFPKENRTRPRPA